MSGLCPVCNKPLKSDASACPSCGFKILGSTQSFKPLALSGDELVSSPDKVQSAVVLRIVRGPQTETVFSLEGDSFTIGRSPQCDIFLNDMTVSRDHANITRVKDKFRIEDAHSFNGVWINNESIESAILNQGDIIQIGAFCLLYQETPHA